VTAHPALDVSCPQCGAAPGAPCVALGRTPLVPAGTPTRIPHARRRFSLAPVSRSSKWPSLNRFARNYVIRHLMAHAEDLEGKGYTPAGEIPMRERAEAVRVAIAVLIEAERP